MNMEENWSYSHTQLALWKLCKRRYYNKYIRGIQEPKSPNMAAGLWLVQAPIEEYHQIGDQSNVPVYWDSIREKFHKELGDVENLPIFNVELAKQVQRAYIKNPLQGKVLDIERRFNLTLPGGQVYQSRPDFVVESNGIRSTWDIKLMTFNQARAGDTFFANKTPFYPLDDQCLGQAICSVSDFFGQIRFFIGKKDGLLIGPVYVEHPVNAILYAEWLLETQAEVRDIEAWRKLREYPWPKNDSSCNAFGRRCHYFDGCNFGFERHIDK